MKATAARLRTQSPESRLPNRLGFLTAKPAYVIVELPGAIFRLHKAGATGWV